MAPFQVIVGNIGTVYDGNNYMKALAKFATYVDHSKSNYGRAAGESVTLIYNGEIKKEFVGKIDQNNID